MLKKERLELINIVIFAIYLVCYLLLCEFFMLEDFIFVRHFLLLGAYGISLLSIIRLHGFGFLKKTLSNKNALWVIPLSFFFLIQSFAIAFTNGREFSLRTLVQISNFLLPTLYVFNLINIIPLKKIIPMVKVSTIIFIVIYFMEPEHSLIEFFNVDNWASIDLLRSKTFTESNICAESFLQMFLFYYYIEKANKNDKEEDTYSVRWYKILAGVFTVLSFKRLGLVFLILVALFGGVTKITRRRVGFKYKDVIFATVMVALTVAYVMFLTGRIFPELDVNRITSSRGWILGLWEKQGYFSYGYGTSIYIIGRYLEMDLVQIYLELGLVSLWLFCYVYFKICNKSAYANVIMIYVMLNLMTASTMQHATSWIFLCVTIFSVLKSGPYDEKRMMHSNGERKIHEKIR